MDDIRIRPSTVVFIKQYVGSDIIGEYQIKLILDDTNYIQSTNEVEFRFGIMNFGWAFEKNSLNNIPEDVRDNYEWVYDGGGIKEWIIEGIVENDGSTKIHSNEKLEILAVAISQ